MNCSLVFRLFIVLLLPLTLCWKILVASAPVDVGEIKNDVAEFLYRHQFDVVIDKKTFNGLPIVITANSGQCRLLVVETTPLGDPIDPIQYLANETDRTFIVFRGATYDDEPFLLTIGNYAWYTLLCRIGLASHIPRVLAVVSSCEARQLPWNDLGFI